MAEHVFHRGGARLAAYVCSGLREMSVKWTSVPRVRASTVISANYMTLTTLLGPATGARARKSIFARASLAMVGRIVTKISMNATPRHARMVECATIWWDGILANA